MGTCFAQGAVLISFLCFQDETYVEFDLPEIGAEQVLSEHIAMVHAPNTSTSVPDSALVEVYWPAELLKGILLVDSPGFGQALDLGLFLKHHIG